VRSTSNLLFVAKEEQPDRANVSDEIRHSAKAMIAAMDGVDDHVRETWHLRDLTWYYA
jgi:hypothetical protein